MNVLALHQLQHLQSNAAAPRCGHSPLPGRVPWVWSCFCTHPHPQVLPWLLVPPWSQPHFPAAPLTLPLACTRCGAAHASASHTVATLRRPQPLWSPLSLLCPVTCIMMTHVAAALNMPAPIRSHAMSWPLVFRYSHRYLEGDDAVMTGGLTLD